MPHLPFRSVPLWSALCGQSNALLLLFTNAWGVPDGSTLESLRAELSALASALLVVGDDDLFYFNARPDPLPSALPAALQSHALSALRQAYGGARRGPTGVTLSLVEPDGCERFRLSRKLRGGVPQALIEALQIARQSVALSERSNSAAPRELLFYSLVGALNLVLSDVSAPEQVAQSARA